MYLPTENKKKSKSNHFKKKRLAVDGDFRWKCTKRVNDVRHNSLIITFTASDLLIKNKYTLDLLKKGSRPSPTTQTHSWRQVQASTMYWWWENHEVPLLAYRCNIESLVLQCSLYLMPPATQLLHMSLVLILLHTSSYYIWHGLSIWWMCYCSYFSHSF